MAGVYRASCLRAQRWKFRVRWLFIHASDFALVRRVHMPTYKLLICQSRCENKNTATAWRNDASISSWRVFFQLKNSKETRVRHDEMRVSDWRIWVKEARAKPVDLCWFNNILKLIIGIIYVFRCSLLQPVITIRNNLNQLRLSPNEKSCSVFITCCLSFNFKLQRIINLMQLFLRYISEKKYANWSIIT